MTIAQKYSGDATVRTGASGLLGPDGMNSAVTWLALVSILVVIRLLVYAFVPAAGSSS